MASYVWGQGRTGYGPHRLKEILADPAAADVLAQAGAALRQEGAVAAYRVLSGGVKGLGPAFFTKFLYFLDQAMDTSRVPRALILDQRVARVVRAHATRLGADLGLPTAAAVAAWTWSDGGWTPHRYEVYLRWTAAAAEQLATAGVGWPRSSPDLLELALFAGAWDPATRPVEEARRVPAAGAVTCARESSCGGSGAPVASVPSGRGTGRPLPLRRRWSAFDPAADHQDRQAQQDGLDQPGDHLGAGAGGGEVLTGGAEDHRIDHHPQRLLEPVARHPLGQRAGGVDRVGDIGGPGHLLPDGDLGPMRVGLGALAGRPHSTVTASVASRFRREPASHRQAVSRRVKG